jgi:chaperonin GroES
MRRKATMAIKVRPLHDRVIVRREAEEEKSKGGIIIPDNAKEKPQRGWVVAVGPGRRDDDGKVVPLGVENGDRVLFGKYSGADVEIDGEKHLILQENDILGVIEK